MSKKVIGLITANYTTDQMQGLTNDRGIASMPYGGRYRLIDFAMSNLINSGIKTIGLITPYKYRSIMDHIGTGSAWMLDRKRGGLYVLPGSTFGMSSKGSRFMLRDIKQNSVYVERSHADYVLFMSSNFIWNANFKDLIKAHERSGADITMVTKDALRDDPNVLSLNTQNGRVLEVFPGVKAGDTAFLDCFIMSRELLLQFLDWYSAMDYLDIFEVLKDDYQRLNVRTWNFDGYARGIFDVRSYYDANMDLLDTAIGKEVFGGENPIRTKVQDYVPARIHHGASVANSLVSSGCNVYGEVDNSILFRGVTIEEGAIVRDSIIMQSCVIKSGAVVKNAVIDRNNRIGKGMMLNGGEKDIFVMTKGNRLSVHQ